MIEIDKLSKKERKRLAKLEGRKEKYVKSESGNFSKKILRRLFIGFVIFVVVILAIFLKTGSEPSTLVAGVIAFLSVEVWQLARIKINENKVLDNERNHE